MDVRYIIIVSYNWRKIKQTIYMRKRFFMRTFLYAFCHTESHSIDLCRRVYGDNKTKLCYMYGRKKAADKTDKTRPLGAFYLFCIF